MATATGSPVIEKENTDAAKLELYRLIGEGYTIDGSCDPGIFSFMNIPNIIGCVGAAIIIIAAIATPIAKSQHMREMWFYVMSGGAVLKVAVVEIARLIR